MKKEKFSNIELNVMLQKSNEFTTNEAFHGLMRKTTQGAFCFEEEVPQAKPYTLNPKLYNGTFISLVRNKKGRIRFSFKGIPEDFDRANFAFAIYNEITVALDHLV